MIIKIKQESSALMLGFFYTLDFKKVPNEKYTT